MGTIKKSEHVSLQSGSSPLGGSPETIEIRNDNSMIDSHRIQSVAEKTLAEEEDIIHKKILGLLPILPSETVDKLEDRLKAIVVEKVELKHLKKVPVKKPRTTSKKTDAIMPSVTVSKPLMHTHCKYRLKTAQDTG